MRDALRLLLFTIGIVIALSFCCLLSSCGSEKYVIAPPEVIHDTTVETQIFRDSVYCHDSVFVNAYTRNDTVFLERVKTKVERVARDRVDTFIQIKTDTLSVPYEVVKEKELNSYDKVALASGRWLLPLLLIIVIFFIVRAIYK